MNAQYFVYTRGNDIANDYKLMFSPANDFCPDDVRKYFLQQVRGLINIEVYQGDLNTPRWLFSRHSGFTLWGIGILNSQLSDINNSDYANRPVRGFFGIIAKSESLLSLPFDIQYFKDLYKQHIIGLWNVSKEDFKQKGVNVSELLDCYELILPQQSDNHLNIDENKTVIWEDTFTPKEMFSTALCVNGNVSCVYGLEEKNHAYNHDYRYYNVVIPGIKAKEEKEYVEQKREPVVVTTKHSTIDTNSFESKKDSRPKIVILIGIVALILILIAICTRGTQTSRHTTSGEKTLKQNPNSLNQVSDSLLIKQERRPN